VLKPNDHVDLSEVSDRLAAEMLTFVKKQGLEGLVAKRSDSIYQPGLRTGLWTKHRINLGHEFVIGTFQTRQGRLQDNSAPGTPLRTPT
jgi:bifunctional non-homologous end joining protein LigD